MIGRDRPPETGLLEEGRKPGIVHMTGGNQPLHHIGAVEALQRNHIADSGQRDDIEKGQQVEREGLSMPPVLQHAQRRDQHEEHHARRTQMPLPRQIVFPVGIDQRDRRRQLRADLVMVDHHHIRSGILCGLKGFMAGGAAVHGDDERRSIGGQLLHRRRVRPIAFENTVGNIDLGCQTEMGQEPVHQSGRRSTIDVIVTEDRNLLTGLDSAHQPLRGLFAIGQHMRIGHQRAYRGIKKRQRVIHSNPAPRQNARNQFGNTVDLRHRQGAVLPGLIQPRHPSLFCCRPLHAQKCADHRIGRLQHRHSVHSSCDAPSRFQKGLNGDDAFFKQKRAWTISQGENREKRADDRHSADEKQQRKNSKRTPVALVFACVEFHAADIVVCPLGPRPMRRKGALAPVVLEQDQ